MCFFPKQAFVCNSSAFKIKVYMITSVCVCAYEIIHIFCTPYCYTRHHRSYTQAYNRVHTYVKYIIQEYNFCPKLANQQHLFNVCRLLCERHSHSQLHIHTHTQTTRCVPIYEVELICGQRRARWKRKSALFMRAPHTNTCTRVRTQLRDLLIGCARVFAPFCRSMRACNACCARAFCADVSPAHTHGTDPGDAVVVFVRFVSV